MRGAISLFAAFLLLALAISPALTRTANTESGGVLPFYSMAQYPLPSGSTGPMQIAADHSGRMWFVEQGSNQIGSYDPSSKSFSEYLIPTANSLPEGIAVDQQGNVWFAELTPNGLGVLFPGNGTIREVTIPPGPYGIACGPIGVTPQGNGSIWVTCEFSNQIDEYVPSAGILKQFDLPVSFSAPLQVLFDSAGNFWFTAADSGMLGYATISQLRPGTTNGIEEFAPLNSTYLTTIVNPLVPGGEVVTSLAVPSQVAFSPDGASLWITEHGAGSFDRYDIASKTLTKYFTSPPSSSLYTQSLPNGIAVGASGLVWVAEHYGNRVAEFDPATGSMVEYPIPCCKAEIAGTLYLADGANGTIWFTESFGNAIGELSPAGSAAPFEVTLNPAVVALGASGTATVSLSASGTGSIGLQAEGVSRDGALVNLTATFEPRNITLGATGETGTLTLTSSGLSPGIYYITVSGTSTTGLVSSTILAVTVSQGFQYWWIVALGVVVILGLCLLGFRRRGKHRKKRHGTSIVRWRPVVPLTRQVQERGTQPLPPSSR